MRGADQRSRRIALVPDRLVNAHLLPEGDPERRVLAAALDLLERLGFGLIQLPAHDLPFERVSGTLDYAIDQLQDYNVHGYLLVRIELPHLPDAGVWRDRFDAEMARRGASSVPVVTLNLTDADTFESDLRRQPFSPAADSATYSAENPSWRNTPS